MESPEVPLQFALHGEGLKKERLAAPSPPPAALCGNVRAMEPDPEDVTLIALDWSVRDLQRLGEQLADPAMVWERWWHNFIEELWSGRWTIHELHRMLLVSCRRTKQELLAAL